MENKDFRNLVESYSTIYENVEVVEETQQIDEVSDRLARAARNTRNRRYNASFGDGGMSANYMKQNAKKDMLNKTLASRSERTGSKIKPVEEEIESMQEADSVEAMRARAAKRRQQRYGKQGGGGYDQYKPLTKADYERGESNDPRKKTQTESVELFDLILSHLLDEGYASTEENALAIMSNMSEEWRDDILMEREMDEPGESDDRSDVQAHNRAVRYRPRPRRPRIEDDPRYGTVRDQKGNMKY